MTNTHTTLIRILADAIRNDPEHPYVASSLAIEAHAPRRAAWATLSAAERERILLAAVRQARKASER